MHETIIDSHLKEPLFQVDDFEPLLCRHPGNFLGDDAEKHDLFMEHLGMGEMVKQLRRRSGSAINYEYRRARYACRRVRCNPAQ